MDIYSSLLSNYISYDRLYAMSNKALYGERVDKGEINLFLDMQSFVKSLWSNMPYSYKDDTVVTASIINACAHYRNYFWTRHMCRTNIYIVWGENQQPYFPYANYNVHLLMKIAAIRQMNISPSDRLVSSARESLAFICKYLPQIYYVDGGLNEVSATIYNLVANGMTKQGIPHIILSKDVYSYQLVTNLPSTFVYRPKKKYINNELVDQSWVVTKSNIFKAYRFAMDYASGISADPEWHEFNTVLALSGMAKRHVRGIYSFNRACMVLNKLKESLALNGQYTIYDVDVALYSTNGMKSTTSDGLTIMEINNILNVAINAGMMQNSPDFIKLKEGLIDLYNPQGIMELSDKEFTEYPLELGEL